MQVSQDGRVYNGFGGNAGDNLNASQALSGWGVSPECRFPASLFPCFRQRAPGVADAAGIPWNGPCDLYSCDSAVLCVGIKNRGYAELRAIRPVLAYLLVGAGRLVG